MYKIGLFLNLFS